MSVLLRQADGFKPVAQIRIGLEVEDPPRFQPCRDGHGHRPFGTALLSAPLDTALQENGRPSVEESLGWDLESSVGGVDSIEVGTQSVITAKQRLRSGEDRREFEVRIGQLEHCLEVSTVVGGVPSAHDLHVLLRHRLLREAHGFKGFIQLQLVVIDHLCDLAPPQGADQGVASGKLDAASLALAEHQEHGDCPVLAHGPNLDPVDPPTAPGVAPDPEPLADPVVSSMDRGVKADVAIVYHDVGVQLREDSPPLVVPAIESIDQPFHDFHVLLRHRLLRQPHGFEGFGVVPVVLLVDDHVLTQHVDGREFHARLGALVCATPEQPHENSISCVGEGDRFHCVGVPGFPDLFEPAHDRFQADEGSRLRPILNRPHNDARVVQFAKSIHVPRVPRLQGGSHNLYVRLRHRPRSIPQRDRRGGCSSGP